MISLIVGLAQSDSSARNAEYDACLERNVRNMAIRRVVVLSEEPGPRDVGMWSRNPKVSTVPISRRALYRDYLDVSNSLSGTVVIANADIYFDWSVGKLEHLRSGEFMAITRADFLADRLPKEDWAFMPSREARYRSSDAWAFVSPLSLSGCAWELGRCGCEVALCDEVRNQLGLEIWNPCFDVRLSHLHDSRVRSQAREEWVTFDKSAPAPVIVSFDRKTMSFQKRTQSE